MRALTPKIWQIGVIAPGILIATCLAEAVLRFMPAESFAYRTWELAIANKTPATAFRPLSRWVVRRAYGDLARMGSFITAREYHDEVFSTDALGFRNPPGLLSNTTPKILLFGTSFSVGCGITDDETLSAFLQQRLQVPVYNAAAPGGSCDLSLIRSVRKRLGVASGVVLIEVLERGDVPQNQMNLLASALEGSGTNTCRSQAGFSIVDFLEDSKVAMLARNCCRLRRNGWLLPRRVDVRERRLLNGDQLLFLSSHESLAVKPREPRQAIEHWTRFAEALKAENLQVIFFLVPEKPTVYGHLLSPSLNGEPRKSAFLSGLAKGLTERGISVVNLQEVFWKRAAEDLLRHKYLYRKDDTHWSPHGIQVAAEELIPEISSALLSGTQTVSN